MSLEPPAEEPKKGPTKVWLPIVLMMGIIAGFVLSSYVPSLNVFPPVLRGRIIDQLITHTFLSTVSISLLVALTVVYVRVYNETRARFSLGITVVMVSLLIQSIIQYPLFLGIFVPLEVGQGSLLSIADIMSIAAYSVFLYFSLD